MMEAAIQLDLITPGQAEALVEKGKTLEGWLVENKKGEAGPARKVGRRMLDRVAVFALLLLNFVVLAGIGWIVLRVLNVTRPRWGGPRDPGGPGCAGAPSPRSG